MLELVSNLATLTVAQNYFSAKDLVVAFVDVRRYTAIARDSACMSASAIFSFSRCSSLQKNIGILKAVKSLARPVTIWCWMFSEAKLWMCATKVILFRQTIKGPRLGDCAFFRSI